MARDCGGCTFCCKHMNVPELDKPAGTWCRHCRIGVGCGNYEERVEACFVFRCQWLIDEAMPDELRPDRSGAMVWGAAEPTHGMIAAVMVDQGRHDRILRKDFLDYLRRRVMPRYKVVVTDRRTTRELAADGTLRPASIQVTPIAK